MSAGTNNAGESPLTFIGEDIPQYTFCILDKATDTITLGATEEPEVIAVQPSSHGVVACVSTKSVDAKYYVRAGEDITMGEELASNADGLAIVVATPGTSGVFAKKTVSTGGLVPVYSF